MIVGLHLKRRGKVRVYVSGLELLNHIAVFAINNDASTLGGELTPFFIDRT